MKIPVYKKQIVPFCAKHRFRVMGDWQNYCISQNGHIGCKNLVWAEYDGVKHLGTEHPKPRRISTTKKARR